MLPVISALLDFLLAIHDHFAIVAEKLFPLLFGKSFDALTSRVKFCGTALKMLEIFVTLFIRVVYIFQTALDLLRKRSQLLI